MQPTVSRNKREGKYSGKYAEPYIVKHWRTGVGEFSRDCLSLKQISAFNKRFGV